MLMDANKWLVSAALPLISLNCIAQQTKQPNIILIVADDLGYSDLGCYGGEIPTPHLDELAKQGLRYTQFYNAGRSCPSRASMITGLYPHQTGIGAMTETPWGPDDWGAPGYKGYLNHNCVTMGEVLREAGYHTYLSGKWHLGMHGQEKWPLQRGFDHFYGILAGACSYLRPEGGRGLTEDNTRLPAPEQPYYSTDAFTDRAIGFIDDRPADGAPYFLFLSYNAPHWPLQAKQEDIDKFLGKYKKGWRAVREARLKRMVKMGLVDPKWRLAQWEARTWDELTEQEKNDMDMKMAVYAAQVHCMDYNIGRLMKHLEEKGEMDNTIIVFLSDNGACAEPHVEKGSGGVDMINDPSSSDKPSYGLPWAQVSNTPYRKYKVRAYEGGTAAPFIVSWPARYAQYGGEIRHNRIFLPDLMATFIDAAHATYPKTYQGNTIFPLEGKTLLPTIEQPDAVIHDYIFSEHFDNCAVWWENWKAVKDQDSNKWELYDLTADRTEHVNMALERPKILKQLVAEWNKWADSHQVYPKHK